jgi:ubiquitin-protein ligase E3 A
MMGNFELPALAIKVRRDNLIQDSVEAVLILKYPLLTAYQLSRYDPDDLKKELRLKFVGEEAVDEGGVKKEWFQLIIRQIFDPKYGNPIHGRYS